MEQALRNGEKVDSEAILLDLSLTCSDNRLVHVWPRQLCALVALASDLRGVALLSLG